MSDAIELDGGWRATVEPLGLWLGVRLHPGGPLAPSHTLLEHLWEAIEARQSRHVIVEMDDVEFFPSLLMGELVRLHKRLSVHGGRLRLCGLQEHPREALLVVGLDRVLPVYASRDEASRG